MTSSWGSARAGPHETVGIKSRWPPVDDSAMDEQDAWDRVGLTADWITGCVATSLDREPTNLVWPTVIIGLPQWMTRFARAEPVTVRN